MARFLFCSFALVLLYPSGIDMYLVGLPHIARDLGASEAQLHIAFSAYLAGMASSMVFAGKIADKAGRQPVAIAGAIVFALASLLCSQAQNSTVFLAGRLIQGIGAGGCYVVAFAILRDTLSAQRRAKVLSMLNGITCIIPRGLSDHAEIPVAEPVLDHGGDGRAGVCPVDCRAERDPPGLAEYRPYRDHSPGREASQPLFPQPSDRDHVKRGGDPDLCKRFPGVADGDHGLRSR